MKKGQLDALSDSLSKAINPTARKQEATTKVLEQFEPLPILSRSAQALAPVPNRSVSNSNDTGVNSTPVSADTVSKLTPASKSQGCEQPKKAGYLKVPNEILDQVLPSLDPSEAVVFLRLNGFHPVADSAECDRLGSGRSRPAKIDRKQTARRLRKLMRRMA